MAEIIDIKEFLKDCGLAENELYPGKRLVKKKPQPGQFKSYCIVYDWTNPDTLSIALKPGLSGKDLPADELKNYPIFLQLPTECQIAVTGQR